MSLTLIVITGPTGVGKTELTLRVPSTTRCPSSMPIPVRSTVRFPLARRRPPGSSKPVCVTISLVADRSPTIIRPACTSRMCSVCLRYGDTGPGGGASLRRSMLYVDAVCKGIDDIPTVRDDIRSLLKRRLATEGLPPLVEELRQLDPVHWEKVDRRNPRRVVHALEICIQTGRPYSLFPLRGKQDAPFGWSR